MEEMTLSYEKAVSMAEELNENIEQLELNKKVLEQ
jgi:hypothetical protein